MQRKSLSGLFLCIYKIYKYVIMDVVKQGGNQDVSGKQETL